MSFWIAGIIVIYMKCDILCTCSSHCYKIKYILSDTIKKDNAISII